VAFVTGDEERPLCSQDVLPDAVRIWAGLDEDDPLLVRASDAQSHYASQWNDGCSDPLVGEERLPATFTEIADMIEQCL
jgi:hypothetical protein